MKPLFEIFRELERGKTDKAKLDTLVNNDSPVLRRVLTYLTDPNVEFYPFTEIPEYTPFEYDGLETAFYYKSRLLYLFAKREDGTFLDKKRMDRCLKDLLESVDYRDAILCLMILKRQLPKGLKAITVTNFLQGKINE